MHANFYAYLSANFHPTFSFISFHSLIYQFTGNHHKERKETIKMLSYRRETALQGTLVLAESGRLELGDNILLIL